MKHVPEKSVPKVLTVQQKETHLAVDRDLLQCADHDANFMKTIITSDESWVYGYNPQTKAQSSQWKTSGSPRPKKGDQVWSKVKVMLTVFFYHEGVIPHEYAPDGQTLTRCTMSKLSVGCMVWCGARDLRCGSEVTGSCTTTMPLHIRATLSSTSWLNIRHGGDKMKHDDSAVGYSKQSVPKVLRTMEGLQEQVCGV